MCPPVETHREKELYDMINEGTGGGGDLKDGTMDDPKEDTNSMESDTHPMDDPKEDTNSMESGTHP